MGKDPKSETAIISHGDFTWNLKSMTALAALSEASTIRLTATIREQEGITYSLGAYNAPQHIPYQAFLFNIEFGADPSRVAQLALDVFAELDKFKADGRTDAETAKAKEIILKEREVNLKSNAFWAEVLKNYAMYGVEQCKILEYTKRVQALSREELKQAVRRYLPKDSYVRVTLLPETAK